jgi:poly(3-hydroxybutyrate) depolymerase
MLFRIESLSLAISCCLAWACIGASTGCTTTSHGTHSEEGDGETIAPSSTSDDESDVSGDVSGESDAGDEDTDGSGESGADDEDTDGSSPQPSSGCGAPVAETGLVELNLSVNGQDRQVWIKIPANYSAEEPLALFFNWHGAGNDAMQAATWLGVPSVGAESALHVYPQGLGDPAGWDGGDLMLFDALIETIEADYCVDTNKRYSIGYSAGGGFSNFLACHRSEQLAAMSVVSFGMAWPDEYYEGLDCPSLPMMYMYGLSDSWASVSEDSRQWLLETNGCANVYEAVEHPGLPTTMSCFDYKDCENPVRFCFHEGGHEWPSTPAQVIHWDFFSEYAGL